MDVVTIAVIPTRFGLGRVLTTPGAERAMKDTGISYASLLSRHAEGDWGDLSPGDKAANDAALASGEDRSTTCRQELRFGSSPSGTGVLPPRCCRTNIKIR